MIGRREFISCLAEQQPGGHLRRAPGPMLAPARKQSMINPGQHPVYLYG
jgi:hypothetical protein